MLENILKVEEVKAIINNVNNVIIVNNCGCHGMGHIQRVIIKPTEMAKYLNRTCIFKIGNKEIDLYNIINQ